MSVKIIDFTDCNAVEAALRECHLELAKDTGKSLAKIAWIKGPRFVFEVKHSTDGESLSGPRFPFGLSLFEDDESKKKTVQKMNLDFNLNEKTSKSASVIDRWVLDEVERQLKGQNADKWKKALEKMKSHSRSMLDASYTPCQKPGGSKYDDQMRLKVYMPPSKSTPQVYLQRGDDAYENGTIEDLRDPHNAVVTFTLSYFYILQRKSFGAVCICKNSFVLENSSGKQTAASQFSFGKHLKKKENKEEKKEKEQEKEKEKGEKRSREESSVLQGLSMKKHKSSA